MRSSGIHGRGLQLGFGFAAIIVLLGGFGGMAGRALKQTRIEAVSLYEDRSRGFGLGLAIVLRLVAAHHGQIRAQSQIGFGTNFTVLLPC